jgi:hypothetical protein
MFNGQINEGKCIISLGKLKKFSNLLETGQIRLEIIAEDTVFTPYESNYQLEQEKKVTVEVIQPESLPKKTMVEVKVQEIAPTSQPKVETKQPIVKKNPINDLVKYLNERANFDGSINSFKKIIKHEAHKKYFNNICENNNLNKTIVLKQILK